MLGGFEALSPGDLAASSAFVARWYAPSTTTGLAIDVGAGIGRVTAGLLLHYFGRVSLLESNPVFTDRARELIDAARLATVFNMRFGDWKASSTDERYDLVWIQWVVIYASDAELTAFLREAAKALRPGGHIGLKDNVLSEDNDAPEFDAQDHSVCRTLVHLERIFAAAGLRVVAREQQAELPAHIYPVWMWMLAPQ